MNRYINKYNSLLFNWFDNLVSNMFLNKTSKHGFNRSHFFNSVNWNTEVKYLYTAKTDVGIVEYDVERYSNYVQKV